MLTDDLYANAAARGDQAAVICGDERLTHAELLERVERLAQGLAAGGIAAGDPVALLLPNSPAFVVSLLAVTGIGAVAVPLNPYFKPDELEFYFRDSGVRAAIADDATIAVAERIAASRERDLLLVRAGGERRGARSLDRLIEEHPAERLPARAPDDDFLFLYSSGSTGRPKRVARTHGQWWIEAESYRTSVGVGSDDTLFCAIPLFHTYGMGFCVATWVRTGATLVIMSDPNPFLLHRGRALELLERHRITLFPGVPFNFRLLAEAEATADLSSLRACFSAGTALPHDAFQAFHERYGVAVRQLYGSTETGVMTINVDHDPVATSASVGTPVPGMTVVALDQAGDPVGPGEEGELVVGGPAVARGYAGTGQVGRESFRDGRYFTGDLGRLDAEGRVFITGRKKLFIEVRGHKVDPLEVEDVLVGHPAVEEAVVVGDRIGADRAEVVKAAVVVGSECTERELIRYCKERLSPYKVPQVIEFRDAIPRSPIGKVLRKELIEWAGT
jgi:long-chain acyl-CoA synthetase